VDFLKDIFLSVVVPAFNESNRIVKTLDILSDYLSAQNYSWEIVVANDGSSDDTAHQVDSWIIANPGKTAHVINLRHKGKGWAVRSGMAYAVGNLKLMCDTDLAMPVCHIADFIHEIGLGNDVVVGSREVEGAIRFNESVVRHIVGRLFNWFVNIFIKSGFKDTQCGFKCFTSDSARFLFGNQFVNGWAFDVEILMLARKSNMMMIEIPIQWHHNSDSRLHIGTAAIQMIKDTIVMKIREITGIYKIR